MKPAQTGDGLGPFLDSGEIITFVGRDLKASWSFYVDRLRLPIEEEVPGRYVMVRTGSTRLCIDLEDAEQRALGAFLLLRDPEGYLLSISKKDV